MWQVDGLYTRIPKALAAMVMFIVTASSAGSQEPPAAPNAIRLAEIDGRDVRALFSAHEALKGLAELKLHEKRLEHYRARLRADSDLYYVRFLPHKGPGDGQVIGGETSLGREVEIVIRRADYGMVRYYFFE